MKLLDGLKQRVFGWWFAGKAEEARVGKLGSFALKVWRFLDGWKTWLWAIAMALKTVHPEWGCWGYVDAAAHAVGWDAILPAVDPGALAQWGTFTLAVGHRLLKAYKLYRAGTPLVEIHSDPSGATIEKPAA